MSEPNAPGFTMTNFLTGGICPSCGKRGKTFILKSAETGRFITISICFECQKISPPRKAVLPPGKDLNCKDLKISVNGVLRQKIVESLPKMEDTLTLLKIVDLLKNETRANQK